MDQPRFPEPDAGELIHTRTYEVRTYKLTPDSFLLRGVVCDEKPAGLYIPDDPDPLWMHLMVVDLTVEYPTFAITAVDVLFREHPHEGCTDITGTYQQLVGLSIARGFNARVKELFGGPRGCTHIGALLSAMAPVAIQSGWSMRMGGEAVARPERPATLEQRRRAYAMNINTCHVWDENGPMVTGIEAGAAVEVPLSVRRRLESLGRPTDRWLTFQDD
ncbi:MAG: hypothetical protein RL330_310 [Actinomycetota bacterium]